MGKVKNDIELSLAAQREFEQIEKGLEKSFSKLIYQEKARNPIKKGT
jgi:hypothetical protein